MNKEFLLENDSFRLSLIFNVYESDILYTYINCPECGKTIIIKDYRK